MCSIPAIMTKNTEGIYKARFENRISAEIEAKPDEMRR